LLGLISRRRSSAAYVKAGYVKNSNLIDIVRGKKNISSRKIFSIANAMGLDFNQIIFFEALVNYNNSIINFEKAHHRKKMMLFKNCIQDK